MNRKKRKTVRSSKGKGIKKTDQKMSRKLAGVFITVVLALVGLSLFITYINASRGEKYKKQVMSQTQQRYGSKIIPDKRGDIYDRNGTIMATSEKVYNVILDCKVVNTVQKVQGVDTTPYVEPTIEALYQVFGLEEDKMRELIQGEATKESQYIKIKEQISITEKRKFEKYVDVSDKLKDESIPEKEKNILRKRAKVKGVWFEDEYLRKYPLQTLACDLIGFTNKGDTADWGIEGYYSDTLNGVDGRQFGYYTENADVEQTTISPKDGNNLVSTADVMIMQIIRSAIEKFNAQMSETDDTQESGAENIGVIVMDPNSGEILGMDSNNWYDLNNPRDIGGYYDDGKSSDEELVELNKIWRNFCISDELELGSTVKPMTVAGALESGAISKEDHYLCNGYEMIDGQRVRCSVYPNAHGNQTLAEAMKNSCNDAMMEIVKQQGAEDFTKYQEIFNFGIKTGIDLPGEAYGRTFEPEKIKKVELATSSFGQGSTGSMIQEAAAFSSVINGGYYYKPHVVKQILDGQGSVISEIDPVLMKQTISPEVSELIRSYCEAVTGPGGTGRHAKVAGYSMGGKTGTAQKLSEDEDGKRKYMGKYLVSFIGYAPAVNPQVVVYVVVDEPHSDYQANSGYAQSIAYDIFEELLPYMNIFRDEDEDGNRITKAEQVDVKELSQRNANGQKKPDNGQGNSTSPLSGEISDPAVEGREEDKTEILGGGGLLENGMTNFESKITN